MWPSWLRRQIVALKIEGSNPFIHPIFFFSPDSLGGVNIGMSPSGKAPDFDSGIRRFESCHPSHDPLAQLAEQLPFKQWVWSSNLQRVTTPEQSPLCSGALYFFECDPLRRICFPYGAVFFCAKTA